VSRRVAILGTGRMGSALARRLTQLEPTLWNRSRARAEQVGVGQVAATPAAAANDADIVISSLTGARRPCGVHSGARKAPWQPRTGNCSWR
jgi:3-hydroxyisobutyrate dehydrogenase-like beta-hydroxyacid dehydrogenase